MLRAAILTVIVLRAAPVALSGASSAPVVIGRDHHLDSGSVASSWRATEPMQDASDAVAGWPLLNRPFG